MSDTTFIYALCEPDTGVVRYVGKANNPKHRLWEHMKERRTTHKRNWLQSLKRRGLRPQIELLLEVSRTEWEFWEREMISIFRGAGSKLINLNGGGLGGNTPSEETLKKISKVNRGRKHSEESRKNMSEGQKGRRHSEETLNKMCESHRGRTPSEETRKKIGNAATAQWKEWRKKQEAA